MLSLTLVLLSGTHCHGTPNSYSCTISALLKKRILHMYKPHAWILSKHQLGFIDWSYTLVLWVMLRCVVYFSLDIFSLGCILFLSGGNKGKPGARHYGRRVKNPPGTAKLLEDHLPHSRVFSCHGLLCVCAWFVSYLLAGLVGIHRCLDCPNFVQQNSWQKISPSCSFCPEKKENKERVFKVGLLLVRI